MTEIRVDASVVVKWAIQGEPNRAEALALLQDSAAAGVLLISPSLVMTEVDSAVRKRAYHGLLPPAEVAKAYAILDAAPVQIEDAVAMRQRAREIAEALNQRLVYDSLYAALAESRGCEFWTADEAFHKVASPMFPFVKYLPDWQ